MHRRLGVAATAAVLAITLGACGGDSPEDAAGEAASDITPAVAETSAAETTSTVAPTTTAPPTTTTTTLPEPDNLILLTANVAGASEPIKVEVVAGEFQLVSGMTARAGSSFSVQESWMDLAPGLGIDIGAGGLELFGDWYDEGTRLIVGAGGRLDVAGQATTRSSAETAAALYPEFCARYTELNETVAPEFASLAEEEAWHQNQVLVYEGFAEMAPADISAEVEEMARWMADFVAMLGDFNWDFGTLLDDPEASAAFDLLIEDGRSAFEAVESFATQHCMGEEPVAAAPDPTLPTFSEVIAEHWPGEPLCETQAGISGGPEMFMFGPFGDEESLMSMREGYAMGFCPGSRYIVAGELIVADGSDYPVGTLLTLDRDLNFVAVSSWD